MFPRGFLSPLLCYQFQFAIFHVLPVLVRHLSQNLPIPVTSHVFLLIMETAVPSIQLHLLPVLPMIIWYANFSAATSKYCFDGFVALLWVNSLHGVEQVCPHLPYQSERHGIWLRASGTFLNYSFKMS